MTAFSALPGQLSPKESRARSAMAKLADARMACAKLRATADIRAALETFANTLRDVYDASLVAIAATGNEPRLAVAVPPNELSSNWPVFLTRLASARSLAKPISLGASSLTGLAPNGSLRTAFAVPLTNLPGALLLAWADDVRLTEDEHLALEMLSQELASALEGALSKPISPAANSNTDRLARDKGEFLSLVAHELRTPLTPMTMLLQSLERKARHGAIDFDAIAKARKQVDRLTQIIGDLIDASRIDTKGLELTVEHLDLVQLVAEVAEMFRSTSPKHEIELSHSDMPVYVRADRIRIEQVLVSLLDNAIKYSPSGGIVRIDSRLTPSSVMLSVIDQGIGIPENQQSQLFERFFRAENAPPRNYRGFGLGLHLAEAIVRKHGGSIEARSELGRGSRFTLTLPLAEPGHIEYGSKAAPHLLLVDDDPDILDVVGDFLEEEGYRVSRAENGAEALRRIEALSPDLVLLDLMMPVTDGWEVLARLRNPERWCRIPIVLLSAHNALAEQAQELHADAYLGKPFEMEILIRKIRELLSRTPPDQALRESYRPAS